MDSSSPSVTVFLGVSVGAYRAGVDSSKPSVTNCAGMDRRRVEGGARVEQAERDGLGSAGRKALDHGREQRGCGDTERGGVGPEVKKLDPEAADVDADHANVAAGGVGRVGGLEVPRCRFVVAGVPSLDLDRAPDSGDPHLDCVEAERRRDRGPDLRFDAAHDREDPKLKVVVGVQRQLRVVVVLVGEDPPRDPGCLTLVVDGPEDEFDVNVVVRRSREGLGALVVRRLPVMVATPPPSPNWNMDP